MFELSAPSKTFLIGEYYVMQQGEAYVLNTEPRFRLRLDASKTNSSFPQLDSFTSFPRMRESSLSSSNLDSRIRGNDNNFNFQELQLSSSMLSPARKFISDNATLFSPYTLTFIDPYNGLGGFGASTAEFLLVYQAKCLLTKVTLDKKLLLEHYLSYAWNGLGFAPSGADLLAQLSGNLCYVNKNPLETVSQDWHFEKLAFHLIHTRNKLATHLHLANLENLNTSELQIIFNRCKLAFASRDEALFCEALNFYHQSLIRLGLVSESSLALIKLFTGSTKILAAKGCGAMGSDILLLITELQQQAEIKKLCKEFNLVYIACNTSLSPGLQYVVR